MLCSAARNQLQGMIPSISLGDILAEVVVAVGPIEVVAVITRAVSEGLGLKAGDLDK